MNTLDLVPLVGTLRIPESPLDMIIQGGHHRAGTNVPEAYLLIIADGRQHLPVRVPGRRCLVRMRQSAFHLPRCQGTDLDHMFTVTIDIDCEAAAIGSERIALARPGRGQVAGLA